MSREAYQVPTTAAPNFLSGGSLDAPLTVQIKYNCGDCAQECKLDKGAPIRCFHCGGRVLYKQRTKRMIQFEAR
ncbi:hypothetical protein P8C59_000509 [Phyllachora maydis]|uniref:Uncharacterized protein n=1 Tax=Phyllachora maydis TaxID=1825666 RepID=A0AAD9M6I8_9PEZI|nr:hypothetical protein P8C59_000509 [Phyllachora maydis]